MNLAKKIDGALLRTATKTADNVRAALRKTVDADKIAADWIATFGVEYSVTPAQARDWARVHVSTDTRPLDRVLDHVYATGWVLGTKVATAQYGNARINKAAPSAQSVVDAMAINWDSWKPGNEPAAALVRPPGGLADLLARKKPVTIKGVNDTTLDRIGTALARGLGGVPEEDIAGGQGRAFIAAEITDILGDPFRALMIAQTEMSRALNSSTMDSYTDFGVEYKEWVALEECELCGANADAGVIPIDEDFPSGDSEPPAHPNCRCTIAPANPPEVSGSDIMGDMNTLSDATDGIELAVSPDRVKGVPGPLEVARALSRLAILPNPNHPDLADQDKYVESPWTVVPLPTVDPNAWDDAVTVVVDLEDLYGTDAFLKRKNIRKHIETMGQAVTPFRSYALIAEVAGKLIIVDGHHRLMASWLLGQDSAAVYKIVIN
jgi:hypothetical protein